MPLLVLFHTPVSKKVFQFFDCDRIGSGDWSKSFLRVDYSIPCSEGEHWLPSYYYFLPYVCVVLVFFTTLLPLSIAIYLRYHRNNLYTPSVLLNLGWLYDRMRRGSEHWELYEMVRKMILTGLIVFFPRNPIIRACLCVLVCVVATAGLNYYRPHKNYLVFWIDQICHAVALLVYVVAMVFESGLDEKSKDQIGDVFIAIFVVLFLIFLAAVIRTIVLVRKHEFQEEFQNHTKVEKLASHTSVNSRRLVNSMAGHVNRKMLHEKNANIELKDMQEGLEEFDLEKMRNLRSKGWKGLISVNSKHFHSTKSSARRIDSRLNATELSKIFDLDKQMASNNQQNGGSLSDDDEDELHQRIVIKRRQSMKDRRKARGDKRKARQEKLFKQGILLDKEAANQQDHPDYLTIKHLMQRLNHQGKLERVIKTISSEDGIIILNRLKTLLKQLKCSDINGLIAFMLTKLSNDDGKTISKNKFKAYCGMLATTKSKMKLENEKFQHPEYKAMRILFQRLHRQGKLDRIVDKISTEDGKDIKLKSFRKLLKQLKCIDINGFSTFLLKELSGEKENMYSVEKFKEWVDN